MNTAPNFSLTDLRESLGTTEPPLLGIFWIFGAVSTLFFGTPAYSGHPYLSIGLSKTCKVPWSTWAVEVFFYRKGWSPALLCRRLSTDQGGSSTRDLWRSGFWRDKALQLLYSLIPKDEVWVYMWHFQSGNQQLFFYAFKLTIQTSDYFLIFKRSVCRRSLQGYLPRHLCRKLKARVTIYDHWVRLPLFDIRGNGPR